MTGLILKRASASRSSGEWSDDDYDVLADGIVVGRVMKAAAAPIGQPWLWTLAYGHHKDRTPTHWLRGDARGRYDGIRETLAAGVMTKKRRVYKPDRRRHHAAPTYFCGLSVGGVSAGAWADDGAVIASRTPRRASTDACMKSTCSSTSDSSSLRALKVFAEGSTTNTSTPKPTPKTFISIACWMVQYAANAPS